MDTAVKTTDGKSCKSGATPQDQRQNETEAPRNP